MGGCYATNTSINTIKHETAESKFKAKIVEKQKRSTWWEHTFELKLAFCEASDASERPARAFADELESCSYNSFRLDSCDVNTAGSVVKATIKVTSSCADAAEAERAADKAVTNFMRRNKNLLDASFELSSDQKEKVTKFDAWDGVDSYG
jgi:hypothetical protein